MCMIQHHAFRTTFRSTQDTYTAYNSIIFPEEEFKNHNSRSVHSVTYS